MQKKYRILMVDDMKLLLQSYAQDFDECGIEVVTAHFSPGTPTSAEHGVFGSTPDIVRYAKLANPPFDAVLSDVDCQNDQFGMRLAKELKAAHYDKPILMFSQAPGEYLEDQLYDIGVKTLWEKPHSFDKVAAMAENIKSILGQHAAVSPRK